MQQTNVTGGPVRTNGATARIKRLEKKAADEKLVERGRVKERKAIIAFLRTRWHKDWGEHPSAIASMIERGMHQ